MDRLERYRQIIQSILSEYAKTPIANGEIESQTIFDISQDHYQVLDIGWDEYRRVHGCVLHLDIKDGKIWVQHNTTEMRIAHELVAQGIPKEDIILGFQPAYARAETGFGVA